MDKIEKIKDWLKPYLKKDKVRDEHEEGFFHCAMLLNDFLDTLSEELDKSLKEAAEEYADKIEFDTNYNDEWINQEDVFNAFKAGAEWMAGQGASYNTEVGWIDGPTVLDWPDNILDGFKMGDKVVVQIRKK